ncbi:MAG: chemotaxis protein CheX [Pseudobdellovibrio sp.]
MNQKNKMNQITDGNILKIELPAVMDKDFSNELEMQVKQWLLSPTEIFALDFQNVKELKQSCYHSILVFAQYLKQAEKKIVSFNLEKNIEHQLKMDGISNAIYPIENFQQYLSEQKSKNKATQLDVKIINPFLIATKNTFEKQANVKCEPLKPILASVDTKTYDAPIALAGVISLTTDTFKGNITLVFSEKVFLLIYESMFGEKHEKINSEIVDAAGELLNIIYGTAKTVLNQEHGYQLKPAIPTILSGEKISVRQQTKQKVIVMPFKTQHGIFQIEISFEETF